MKNTPIPKYLRPSIRGATVESSAREITEEGGVLDTSIMVLASADDPTAEYFMSICHERSLAPRFIAIETLTPRFVKELSLLMTDTHKSVRFFSRPCEVKSIFLQCLLSRVLELLTFLPGRIINRPNRASLNQSKPLQMTHIGRIRNEHVGDITTNITTAYPEPAEELIIKSVSCERSQVILADELLPHAKIKRSTAPMQLQPFITGTQVRVHVVGVDCFAVQVNATGIDYRYASDISLSATTLSSEVFDWCVRAAREEGLTFAGIDLIKVNNSSNYKCLEINPCPAYHFFEKNTYPDNKAVSNALIDYLLES